jgi:hypothetical protein
MSKLWYTSAGKLALCSNGRVALSDNCPCEIPYFSMKFNIEQSLFRIGFSTTQQYAIIDWGDGETQSLYESGWKSYSHVYATAGEYLVTVYGNIREFTLGDICRYQLTEIDVGNMPFEKFNFNRPGNLTTLTGKLNGTRLTNIESAFWQAYSLQAIPAGFFDNCNLLKDCHGAFSNCTSLQAIPAGLFDNCVLLEDCNVTFSSCTSLQAIPNAIFNNCPNIKNLSLTFSQCTSLQGASGQLWLNNSSSPIYTLQPPDYDAGTPLGWLCYAGCTGLSDYNTIPDSWKIS